MLKKPFGFFTLSLFLAFSLLLQAAPSIQSFWIDPPFLFSEDDVGVLFSARLEASAEERPPSLILIELDASGQKPRFQWVLTDDGTQGDRLANDGIYSRRIQFKERVPKKIRFVVIPPDSSPLGLSLSSSQFATLETRAHPTFIEIMGDVIHKIQNH